MFADSDGFVLVYSITSGVSFSHAQKLKERLTQMHGAGKPIIFAGNKLDLEDQREVSEEEGETNAQYVAHRAVTHASSFNFSLSVRCESASGIL